MQGLCGDPALARKRPSRTNAERRLFNRCLKVAGERENKDHNTVTKADLVEEVTRVTELPRKESEAVVETIFESIITALQGDDKIEIRGFGSFRTRQRRGRTGRNPKTGRQGGSAAEEDPLLQAQQGTEGLRQQSAGGGAAAGSPEPARD